MRSTAGVFAGLLSLGVRAAAADPTWPAATDEIEEIVYQLKGFKARLFADTITPCSNEASGPGRQNAAEWLRIGFHDMSTANTFFGTGGLDASIQFELSNGENTGPGHNTTLQFLSNYYSTRASMSDLIAAGVAASVRSCNGPIVPLRLGRVDATGSGNTGVPQPQNAAQTFVQQFDRMGFSVAEMIQVTACGHTLGGVHRSEFPELMPANAPADGEVSLDSTDAVFDNKIVTEYLADNTTNPLVREPSISNSKNSDFKVFSVDNNVTMQALAPADVFAATCQKVLQKMIDTVPKGVVLTDTPLAPYTLKPVDLQLTLNAGGSTVLFTGYIRLRTTNLDPTTVDHLVLTYKDRNGGSSCGSSSTCSTTSTYSGASTGFDESFVFFPISTNIDTSTGISSFTVSLVLKDGTTQNFDNNGNGYPVSDAVILQKPQSCLLQGTGALTVAGLVRNDLVDLPVNLNVSYLVPRRTKNGNPVPAIKKAAIPMTAGKCVGQYTFYTASYSITGDLSFNARLDVTAGTYGDYFRVGSSLAGTCRPYDGAVTCSNVTAPASSSSSIASSTQPASSSLASSTVSVTSSAVSSSQPAISSIASSTLVSSTTTKSSVGVTSTVSSGAVPSQTLGVRKQVGGYNFVNCWTEGIGSRALDGAAFAYDGMTLETCMTNCTGFAYWGTEYGRECYCGNQLAATSTQATDGDCSMLCSGNPLQYCGGGSRLELYSTTASLPAAPTGTLAVKPTVGKWFAQGCITEGTGKRALPDAATANDGMTLELCSTFCDGYKFFGTEYGRECYCGNSKDATSSPAPQSDCSMTCGGNPFEYCGAGNRLQLYGLSASGSTASSLPVKVVSTSSGASTLATSASSATSKLATTSSTVPKPTTIATTTSTKKSSSSSQKPAQTKTSTNKVTSVSTSAVQTSSSAAVSSSAVLSSVAQSSVVSSVVPIPTVLAHRPAVSLYDLVGCWTEGDGERALSAKSYASGTDMTLNSCAAFCKDYKYFGVEYAQECYCGDSLATTSKNASLADCSMPCVGDKYEYCGAGNRLELYMANITLPTGPSQPASVAGGWSFVDCYTEGTGTRALNGAAYADDNMTLEMCAGLCADFSSWGTEYGRECYCGSSIVGNATAVARTECSFPCAGNSTELCGAGSRLSLYSKTATKRRSMRLI